MDDSVDSRHPSFRELVTVSAKIGFLGFGGPAGQIALMHRLVVEERRWISEERYLAALNYCMLLPGPEAQQLATYIGWHLHGIRGGLVSGLLFVLPGFVLITVIASVYAAIGSLPLVEALFYGLKAAVLAIVVEALIRIGKRALKDRFAVGLAAAAFLAIYVFAVPFPVIVLAAALLGAWRTWGQVRPLLAVRSEPMPHAHTRATILTWATVWASLPLAVVLATGWESVFAKLAGFFSVMAVVTFGGAYAVLAYVAQAAVGTFGWLTPGEMLDALAMAETTPGPLILVLVFVGTLAGARDPGVLDPVLGGLLGAVVTAWVTFAPSFLWIFAGAPWVDRIIASPRLKSALSAVTAAVVGVILNLTVWFALHVLFASVPKLTYGPVSVSLPDPATLDPVALVLSLVAALMVFRLHAGLVKTLGLAALLGLAVRLGPGLLQAG